MPTAKRTNRSPFYITPGEKDYHYPRRERIKIVLAHLRRDVLKSRKLTITERSILLHAAVMLVQCHQDLTNFEQGKTRQLPKDYQRNWSSFTSALEKLRPKAPPKTGSQQSEGIGLADILKNGGQE